jgi:hypothetical protein
VWLIINMGGRELREIVLAKRDRHCYRGVQPRSYSSVHSISIARRMYDSRIFMVEWRSIKEVMVKLRRRPHQTRRKALKLKTKGT